MNNPLISMADLRSLGASLSGTLVTAADHEYDDARALWNAMIDRRPELIVRAGGDSLTFSSPLIAQAITCRSPFAEAGTTWQDTAPLIGASSSTCVLATRFWLIRLCGR